MNLEELIRDMAHRGELTHLSLSPVDKVDSGNGKMLKNIWAASFCPASPGGYVFILDMDPVEALCRSMQEAKLRRRKPATATEGGQ